MPTELVLPEEIEVLGAFLLQFFCDLVIFFGVCLRDPQASPEGVPSSIEIFYRHHEFDLEIEQHA